MKRGSSFGRVDKRFLAAFAGVMAPHFAHAHVKWFSTIANCRASPITPLEVVTSPFFIHVGLFAAFAMTVVALVDGQVSRRGSLPVHFAMRVAQRMDPFVPLILRYGVALYFVATVLYFGDAPIILTPELKTAAVWVPMLQLTIAVTALFRRTVIVAAMGIILLYTFAASTYGWFHMLDYPIFAGIAACLIIDSVYGSDKRPIVLTILRVTTGFTFMWGGLEKWLYPGWTLKILEHDLHTVLMGFSPEFFVLGAAFVEVCLALVLIFGRIASQVASAVLLILMILAVPLVGLVDLIGHLPFVIVLLILATTGNLARHDAQIPSRIPNEPWDALGQTRCFVVTVAGAIWAYYLSHELAYGDLHPMNWTTTLLATLFVVLTISRIALPAPSSRSAQHAD